MKLESSSEVSADSNNWRHDWRLQDEHGGYDLNVSLPCDVYSALYNASLISDPYFARNEYEVRWVAHRDWVLEKSFNVESLQCDLVLSELDTVAKVYINDHCVLECENQFRTYRINISDVIHIGVNTLKIVLLNSIKAAEQKQHDQPWYVPWHQGNCPIPNGNMLRKVQCDFGWDWNIALAPMGLYGHCYIQTHDIQRLDNIVISQSLSDDLLQATVQIDLTVLSSTPDPVDLSSTLYGHTLRATTDTKNTQSVGDLYRSEGQMIFTIDNPELWWPNGLGSATLHELVVKTESDEHRRMIGFRTIELVTEADKPPHGGNTRNSSEGSSFYFRVNGIDIFAKGANWIPADALPARITDQKTTALLQAAVDANMNMIRVWGGGRYESDHFYHTCDELGLLVWQDFMFACNLYPHTEDFLDEVRSEVRDVVKRLHHHTSIALWCGDNELVGALTWFEESVANRDRYLVAYDRLNHTIEQTLFQELPDANWWPSSPSSGRLDFGDAWHDDQSGDMHFWSVWHEGKDFEHYRDIRPRFCSEFGFQSYPSMPVIRSFTKEQDLNIASPVMESHQKNAGGNARIAETMFRYFRFPNGFENFVYLSQVQQSIAIKTAVDYWRSEKPHCMGSLYWQLNDTWPVASWSSLNYGGSWKLLHHVARRFYQPTTVVCIPDKDGWNLIATSDLKNNVTLRFIVGAISLDGNRRTLTHGTVHLNNNNNAKAGYIDEDLLNEDEWLFWHWTDGETSNSETNSENTNSYVSGEPTAAEITKYLGDSYSTDCITPNPYKTYNLPDAEITFSVSETEFGFSLELQCLRPALFVTLEADVEGDLSDNAFTLLPGFNKRVHFKTNVTSATPPNFIIRDLQTATK